MSDVFTNARAEFERFDLDGDGVITAAEIRQVNQALGAEGLSDVEIELAVGAADQNGDGRIGLEEFIALLGGGRHEKG